QLRQLGDTSAAPEPPLACPEAVELEGCQPEEVATERGDVAVSSQRDESDPSLHAVELDGVDPVTGARAGEYVLEDGVDCRVVRVQARYQGAAIQYEDDPLR